jgi:hypothetical protein
LDSACRDHDIAYARNKSVEDRHKADWVLENRAWERVKSKDAKLGEKAAAWFVTTAMKAKRNLGMGLKKSGQRRRRQPASFRRDVVLKIANSLKKQQPSSSLRKTALSALKAARIAVKRVGGKKNIRIPRIIPLPAGEHSGGFLPLLMPILGALGALGSLAGGAGAVAKTVIDAKNAAKKLMEDRRHNEAMEAIGAKGSGLYLRKNRHGGYGLFLKKQKNCQ